VLDLSWYLVIILCLLLESLALVLTSVLALYCEHFYASDAVLFACLHVSELKFKFPHILSKSQLVNVSIEQCSQAVNTKAEKLKVFFLCSEIIVSVLIDTLARTSCSI